MDSPPPAAVMSLVNPGPRRRPRVLARMDASGLAAMGATIESEAVRIGARGLQGQWVRPVRAIGLVVFAHGSGSSRGSPRNRFVAEVLHQHRLATLRFDLLTEDEAQDRSKMFDIALLARRLREALDWLRESEVAQRRVGLFGASTGAAAALQAAAELPGRVGAVVSRGGRADLAASFLPRVQAPTLLIVGGADAQVLELNRAALRALRCEKRLEIVPGATHLFEEPGALDAAAHLAADWFVRHAEGVSLQ
jgi:putative phosphoribosyl transferase